MEGLRHDARFERFIRPHASINQLTANLQIISFEDFCTDRDHPSGKTDQMLALRLEFDFSIVYMYTSSNENVQVLWIEGTKEMVSFGRVDRPFV